MAVNLQNLLSWVSAEAVEAPEPIVLLVLGALFIALSFRVRRKSASVSEDTVPSMPRTVVAVTISPASRSQLAAASSALAAQEAR